MNDVVLFVIWYDCYLPHYQKFCCYMLYQLQKLHIAKKDGK
jgi:hypothetical protein